MDLGLVLFSTACLSCFLAPATGTSLYSAALAPSGVVIGGTAGVVLPPSGGETVVIETNPGTVAVKPPAHQVVVEHRPVTLIPVATIPSYSLTDRVSKLWTGISDSISTKIKAVGDFFRGPPHVVVINTPTTKKPCRPVAVEIGASGVIEIPHHRTYPMPVAVLQDCN